jgi:hypothetical protein
MSRVGLSHRVHRPLGDLIVGFGLVWLLVISYPASLAFGKSQRTPYDRLAGSEVLMQVQQQSQSAHAGRV